MALIAGCCVLFLGLAELLQDGWAQERYSALAEETADETVDGRESSPHRELPSAALAWVEVKNTGISLPVAGGARGDSWYLTHDLWDNESALGCPFLDSRCASPQGPHVMVYGHHLAFTSYMFSPLHLCFRQDRFSDLGPCVWTTRQGESELVPLCALSVDASWPDICRFSFSGQEDFHAWLASIVQVSSAHAPNALWIAGRAHRVVTLITCTSNRSGQPWRTLVLFAA